jgi:hypothetical protein
VPRTLVADSFEDVLAASEYVRSSAFIEASRRLAEIGVSGLGGAFGTGACHQACRKMALPRFMGEAGPRTEPPQGARASSPHPSSCPGLSSYVCPNLRSGIIFMSRGPPADLAAAAVRSPRGWRQRRGVASRTSSGRQGTVLGQSGWGRGRLAAADHPVPSGPDTVATQGWLQQVKSQLSGGRERVKNLVAWLTHEAALRAFGE